MTFLRGRVGVVTECGHSNKAYLYKMVPFHNNTIQALGNRSKVSEDEGQDFQPELSR